MALRYFKTPIAELAVVVGKPDTKAGEVAPQTVNFVPYAQRLNGDASRMGYLATDNDVAIKKLIVDVNVTEIKKDEFEEATAVESDEKSEEES